MTMAVVETLLESSDFKVAEFKLLEGSEEATRDWLAGNALKVHNSGLWYIIEAFDFQGHNMQGGSDKILVEK